MARKQKYYVVWEGLQPGIYLSWDECRAQIEHFKGARYKSFSSLKEATAAFRRGSADELQAVADLLLQARQHRKEQPGQAWKNIPEVDKTAIAVDAACSGNPGTMEYRGVDLATGEEIFHVGPLSHATNNIGEYLALVHVLALCKQQESTRPVYSDSRTALSWLHRRGHRSQLKPTAENATVMRLLARADAWVQSNTWPNRVMKWNTEEWGEIPADFGRK